MEILYIQSFCNFTFIPDSQAAIYLPEIKLIPKSTVYYQKQKLQNDLHLFIEHNRVQNDIIYQQKQLEIKQQNSNSMLDSQILKIKQSISHHFELVFNTLAASFYKKIDEKLELMTTRYKLLSQIIQEKISRLSNIAHSIKNMSYILQQLQLTVSNQKLLLKNGNEHLYNCPINQQQHSRSKSKSNIKTATSIIIQRKTDNALLDCLNLPSERNTGYTGKKHEDDYTNHPDSFMYQRINTPNNNSQVRNQNSILLFKNSLIQRKDLVQQQQKHERPIKNKIRRNNNRSDIENCCQLNSDRSSRSKIKL